MKSKSKLSKVIVDILNNNPRADVSLLEYYDPYIIKVGTKADDDTTYVDEDLIQEIRVSVLKAIPQLRNTLIEKHIKSDSVIILLTKI